MTTSQHNLLPRHAILIFSASIDNFAKVVIYNRKSLPRYIRKTNFCNKKGNGIYDIAFSDSVPTQSQYKRYVVYFSLTYVNSYVDPSTYTTWRQISQVPPPEPGEGKHILYHNFSEKQKNKKIHAQRYIQKCIKIDLFPIIEVEGNVRLQIIIANDKKGYF